MIVIDTFEETKLAVYERDILYGFFTKMLAVLEGYFCIENSSEPRNSGCKKWVAIVQGGVGWGWPFKRGTTVMVDNVNIHKTVHQSMGAGYAKVRVVSTIFFITQNPKTLGLFEGVDYLRLRDICGKIR